MLLFIWRLHRNHTFTFFQILECASLNQQLSLSWADFYNLIPFFFNCGTLGTLECFGKIKKSKVTDPGWPLFESVTLFLRHVTSSSLVGGLQRKHFGRTFCPLSLVVIRALIFPELRRGAAISPLPPPHPRRPKKVRSDKAKLIWLFRVLHLLFVWRDRTLYKSCYKSTK